MSEKKEKIDEKELEEVSPEGVVSEDSASGETSEQSETVSDGIREGIRLDNWYVLRVQSNREEKIKNALSRRVKEANLECRIQKVLVPKEAVSEVKGRKKRVVEKILYPGYIFVQMEVDDDTYHFVRETPGVGDFVGPMRKPAPMTVPEVEKMLFDQKEQREKGPSVNIKFQVGDAVKIKSGPFENFDGVIDDVNPQKGMVTVSVTIFGRATPVELEYWQVERI